MIRDTKPEMLEAERLTLGVLLCGVAALAFSDFVRPGYGLIVALTSVVRLMLGSGFALSEQRASLIGWLGFFWGIAELLMRQSVLVVFTAFLLILSLAVCVETATPRNHLHRLITGLFLVLAGAVLTDSALYALPLLVFMLLMWRACRRLYGLKLPGGDLPLESWSTDMRIFAFTSGIAVLLFVMLPRFDTGLTLKNIQPKMAVSGFSDQVQFGDFARLLDPSVVMRVEAQGKHRDDQAQGMIQGRYWRGVALSRFQGANLHQSPEVQAQTWQTQQDMHLDHRKGGLPIVVYREAMDHPYIFVPDGLRVIHHIPHAVIRTTSGSLKFATTPARRQRLFMRIGKNRDIPEQMRPPNRWERDMSASPVIQSWARHITQGRIDSLERLHAIQSELQSWKYDLNAPIDADHPIESFIETTQRGHCELFAAAMTLTARSLGIPARVVNGYYGGEWNDVGHFLLIRQQHAHAWVEAWLNGHWQRFDPTPAVRWGMSGVQFPAWDHIWESLRLAWYRNVLEFENKDRRLMWTRSWEKIKQWQKEMTAVDLRVLWMLLAGLGILGWFGRMIFTRIRQPLIEVLDKWLIQHGSPRQSFQAVSQLPTPEDVPERRWNAFVSCWEQQVYGAAPAWHRKQLTIQLRALKSRRRQ